MRCEKKSVEGFFASFFSLVNIDSGGTIFLLSLNIFVTPVMHGTAAANL